MVSEHPGSRKRAGQGCLFVSQPSTQAAESRKVLKGSSVRLTRHSALAAPPARAGERLRERRSRLLLRDSRRRERLS